MNKSPISPHWYRVANLKPRLHHHIEVHRHDYRGLIWYILEDTATGRNHRFNPTAYLFIGMLDGDNCVQDIFDQMTEQLDEYAPEQEEIIQLIGQLHSSDLIKTDAVVNTEDLLERKTSQQQSKLKQRLMNPMALKVALWDPESFLNAHIDKVKWLFTRWVALIWLITIFVASFQAVQHWSEIQAYFNFNALSPYNLILMILLYPPIKFLHELGHAFSTKLEKGEVHEMGINFLMFMPVPYVNVSASANFRSKYKRMLVSASGILVESFLAALGLLLFLSVEPGIVQSIGFNTFVIGGMSSLLFNGNPLLKYDAYYVLADSLSIPNLYQRAGLYWRYFFKRYLFGITEATSPATAPGETFWFICYSIASQCYRLLVLWFIFTLLAEKFFLAALLLTGWLFSLQVLFPLSKAMLYVLRSPELRHNRLRPMATSLGTIGIVVVLGGFTSVPAYTLAEGIVWQSEDSLLKAEQEGFAGELKVRDNQVVEANTEVIRLHDPYIKTELKITQARVRELQYRYRSKRVNNSFQAGIVKEELNIAESELEHVRNKINSMTVTALKKGTIIIPDADDLQGRYLQQGELLGYILDKPLSTIRMAVSQDNIGQLRQNVEAIKVRFASNHQKEYSATIIRQAPEGTSQLPSKVLSIDGGGNFFTSSPGSATLRNQQKIFVVDLEFDPNQEYIALGTRAHIRIFHGGESMAKQIYRRIRQVFLRQFNV